MDLLPLLARNLTRMYTEVHMMQVSPGDPGHIIGWASAQLAAGGSSYGADGV